MVFSILLSTLFGQPLDQFAFTDGFSFSIGGTSALLTILLAAAIEEAGWRGYGEDSVASYFSWFTESIIFGFVWAFWHLPLFWINGTYHAGLKVLGLVYVLNFLISVVPMGVFNDLGIREKQPEHAGLHYFHLFVNTMQEKIAMTPQTKRVETMVVTLAAVLVVTTNKEMFFEKEHIGDLLTERT